MKRTIPYIALLVLALAAGAATGIYRARQTAITSTPQTADQDNGQAPATAETSAPTTDTAAQPASTATPVPLPDLVTVKYNANSTVEALAVNAVNSFEIALNKNSIGDVQGVLADSVDTGTLPVLLSGMKTRPISFTFDSVEARTDDSVLITITEKRQNDAGETSTQKRELELVPREKDYAVGAYRVSGSTEPLSGFAD